MSRVDAPSPLGLGLNEISRHVLSSFKPRVAQRLIMIRLTNPNSALRSDVLGKCQVTAVVTGLVHVAPIHDVLRRLDIARFLLAQLLGRARAGHLASGWRNLVPAAVSATWTPELSLSGLLHVSYRRLGKPGSVPLQARF